MSQSRQCFLKKSFLTLHHPFSQESILVPLSKYIQSFDNLSSPPVSALIPAAMTSHLDYPHPQEDILGSSQSEHETPPPKTLHWLPTSLGVTGRVPTPASRLRVIPQNPCPLYYVPLTVHTPATLVSLVLSMFLSSFRIWLPATSPWNTLHTGIHLGEVPIPFQFFFKSKLSRRFRFTLITLLNTPTAHHQSALPWSFFFFYRSHCLQT